MAYRLIWSPTAQFDLKDIAAYISENNPEAATRFVRNIFTAVERLPLFPDSGRVVLEFQDPTIREIIRRPCRIVYRVQRADDLIEIARIWHGARGIVQIA
jgi:toxin ParE1/3/4